MTTWRCSSLSRSTLRIRVLRLFASTSTPSTITERCADAAKMRLPEFLPHPARNLFIDGGFERVDVTADVDAI